MNIALEQATKTFAAEQTERPFSPPLSRTHPPGLHTLRVGALRPRRRRARTREPRTTAVPSAPAMARQRGPEVADKRHLSETTLALLQPASDAGDQSVAIPAAITA
jgi:putative transposase